MKKINKRINLAFLKWIFIIIFGCSGVLTSEEPRFYISTDKIFSPGDDCYVTVECRFLDNIDIRVYQLHDPNEFFLSQENSHQPREYNAAAGINTLEIITSVLDHDKLRFRQLLRRFVKGDLRATITGKYTGLKEVAIPSGKIPAHSKVQLLGDYPLLRHFRHTFEPSESEWLYERIPVFENKPGVYLVEAVNGEDAGYTLIVVSNIAIITKQSHDTLVCYVVNKLTGEPMKDAGVSVLRTGSKETMGAGKTDVNGLFRCSIKETAQLTIIARKDNDFAIIDPAYFPVSIDHQKVYIYTDRPVYRPAQEVFYKGIAREWAGEEYKTSLEFPVTVRVYDPKGQQITEQSLTANRMGTFNGHFRLGDEPLSGTYKLVAIINGKQHQGEFKIKSYQKPKFKVDVELEGSGISGSTVKGSIRAKYYFGSPVPDATVQYSVFCTRYYMPSWANQDYSWYYSDSEYRSTRQELISEGEGKLDKQGYFYFQFETKAEDKDYTYRVEARVKDSSNYTIIGNSAIQTSQGQFHIGLYTDRLIYNEGQTVNVSFYTYNINHKPLPAGFGFKAILLTETRQSTDGTPVIKETEIYSKQVETGPTGCTSLQFKLKGKGHIKLVARGIDQFENVIQGTTSIWSAASGEPVSYSGEGIEIISDQPGYKPGDKARFLVLSQIPDIPFLFSVEGGNLYRYEVRRLKGNACIIEIPLESRYSPNVYVQVASIFEDRFYEKRKTVIIPPIDKLLTVSMKTDREIYRPGDDVNVEVQVVDYKKRAVQVELSLGVVDESIYAVNPELTVEIEKFFYPRKRNNVRTYNSLTFNFYGYSLAVKKELAQLEMRPDSGLANFKARARSMRQNFKDTCFWTPQIMTDKNGKAVFSFRLPDNITQWRLTSRCVNYYTQVGSGTAYIISRRDLSVLMDPPLSFTQGDQVVIPVQLKNITAEAMNGTFDFIIKGGNVVGDFNRSFTLKPMGSMEIPVTVKISGVEDVVLFAAARAGRFNDGMQLTVPVTPYGVEKILARTDYLLAGENKKSITFELPVQAINRFYRCHFYIHHGVYRAILSSLNYLAEYPYGCVEQTMSGFLPDVVLAGVLKQQGIDNPSLQRKVDEMIGVGVSRLLGMQDQAGGWGWWQPGEEKEGDAFMTVYVMYGLTLARNLGYKIPDEPYEKGLAMIEGLLAREISPGVRVMSLYVLSLAGRAPVSIIMDTYNKRNTLSPYSTALLTLALAQSGKSAEAATCAEGFLQQQVKTGLARDYWEGEVQYLTVSQPLPIETTAMVVQALVRVNPRHPAIARAVHWLLNQRTGERWASTRDTAAVVMALSQYLASQGIKEIKDQPVRIRLNDHPWQTVGPDVLFSDKGESVVVCKREWFRKGENRWEIEKETGQELFTSMWLSYYTDEEEVQTTSGPLQIQRRYFGLEASDARLSLVQLGDEEPIVFRSGQEFLVQLDIEAAETFEYMVLEDYIPAGFQVIDNPVTFWFEDESINEQLTYKTISHKEVRDNRMVFFFDRVEKGKRTVYYLMRAALAGEYQVNPAVIRSMYFDYQKALSRRTRVNVTDEDETN